MALSTFFPRFALGDEDRRVKEEVIRGSMNERYKIESDDTGAPRV